MNACIGMIIRIYDQTSDNVHRSRETDNVNTCIGPATIVLPVFPSHHITSHHLTSHDNIINIIKHENKWRNSKSAALQMKACFRKFKFKKFVVGVG